MDKVLDSTLLSSTGKRKGTLAIDTHPDNIELGCGVSLACLAQKGTYIAAVVTITGNSGTDGIIDRHEESRNALKVLGYRQTIHLNFADTRAHLQLSGMISVLEDIIKSQIPSDAKIMRVYTMHDANHHQDHLTVYQASMVACRITPRVLGYGTPSTWLLFMPQVFESVKEEHFTVKFATLKKHKSQERRDCMHHDHLCAVIQFCRQQIDSNLGEGFVIHKMILQTNYMKTWTFICISIAMLLWLLSTLRRKSSQKKGCVDATIPAYSESPCLTRSLDNLLRNPYFCRVICANDGSTGNTEVVMAEVKRKWGDRFVAITQKSIGKGGALMNGLNYATCDQVFLGDADTCVPPGQDGMGYALAEIERGTDVVGDIPSTALKGAGLLPHIHATAKLPMIIMKRTLRQLLGDAPFIISDTCGMFRTDVLCKFGFSGRTKVGDLDPTWTLMVNDYRTRRANRHVVYPQGCNSPREEWRRWRRWVVGYVVYMHLHKRLLFSHFGIFSMFPMLLVVLYGVGIYLTTWFNEFIATGSHGVVLATFPLIQVDVVCVIGAPSAWFHRCQLLVPLAPLSIVYVLLAYAIWITYEPIAFSTGREPWRGKPIRYSTLVGVSAAYLQPSVTGTEKLSET